jgi:Secretion system C-terminal sorting domain
MPFNFYDMKKILILFLIYSNSLFSQDKSGHQWVLENFSHLDFTSGQLIIKSINPLPQYGVGSKNTTLSDSSGNILLSTGGCFILNKEFKLLSGGDSINSPFTYRSWCKEREDGDFPVSQGNIILPYPDSPYLKIVFNLDLDRFPNGISLPPIPYKLYYHIVDMRLNNGLGAVVEFKKIAISDTLAMGGVKAIKHKNGKNWWIVIPKWNSNCLLITELTPTGLKPFTKQCMGITWNILDDASNQIDASPDASLIARVSNKTFASIYQFNNSTGIVSNPMTLTFPVQDTIAYLRGVAFSTNSRYLYLASRFDLFQYDLKAIDVQQSRQLIADLSKTEFKPGQGELYFAKLAPDGKIYISSPFFHRYLSVINRPNCPGTLCDFKPHAIELPYTNYSSLPNNALFSTPPANYTCDSLNTATEEISENFTIYPNPTTGILTINTANKDLKDLYVEVINLNGQVVKREILRGVNPEMNIQSLPTGLYFLKIKTEEGIGVAKILKQ